MRQQGESAVAAAERADGRRMGVIAATLIFLGTGYYLVYRRRGVACTDGKLCARPLPRRGVKLALWAATALVASAVAFPYVARALLGT